MAFGVCLLALHDALLAAWTCPDRSRVGLAEDWWKNQLHREEIYSSIATIYARRGVDGLDEFNRMVRTTL